MNEYYKKKLQVANSINAFNELKSMYMRLIAVFPEAIQNNEFYASANAIDDMKVEVSAIGSKVEIFFDYVIANDDVFGVIKCDEIISNDLRVNLTNYYFDWDGRTYLAPGDGKPIQGLSNRYYPGILLFQICEALLARHIQPVTEAN